MRGYGVAVQSERGYVDAAVARHLCLRFIPFPPEGGLALTTQAG